ncbi:unnamed protein product [Nezara viridula]|uniref:Uncharacterized protein n=1 Tax=Nezara viridula TaxID=85310 RepID=A0A9P0H2R5_NEZVI|nr:unnamed protein product [Nezara viridula]
MEPNCRRRFVRASAYWRRDGRDRLGSEEESPPTQDVRSTSRDFQQRGTPPPYLKERTSLIAKNRAVPAHPATILSVDSSESEGFASYGTYSYQSAFINPITGLKNRRYKRQRRKYGNIFRCASSVFRDRCVWIEIRRGVGEMAWEIRNRSPANTNILITALLPRKQQRFLFLLSRIRHALNVCALEERCSVTVYNSKWIVYDASCCSSAAQKMKSIPFRSGTESSDFPHDPSIVGAKLRHSARDYLASSSTIQGRFRLPGSKEDNFFRGDLRETPGRGFTTS